MPHQLVVLFRRVTVQLGASFSYFICNAGSVTSRAGFCILQKYRVLRACPCSCRVLTLSFMYLPLTEDDEAVDRFVADLPGVGLYAGSSSSVAVVVESSGMTTSKTHTV
jgi:hypothetical protein